MNGYINLIVFILTTILYFYSIKPEVNYDTLETPQSPKGLAIYALIILLTQFGLNISAIIEKCGGSASQNIGVAALFTFLPWTLIFGVVLAVLIAFPGFKTAFSDVIGYFYISDKAHILFSEMLAIKGDVAKTIETLPTSEQPAASSTADVLIKLCGNMGILINQIVPSNFKDYWQLLQPLMKTDAMLETQPLYQNFIVTEREKEQEKAKEEGMQTIQSVTPQTGGQSKPASASDYYRDELLKLVVSRDNVGEFMWYLYTGVLVISIVQYYILSRGCLSDASTMEKNYQKFLQNEDDIKAQQDAAGQNTTYTITS
jgi:hypothetical protein